MRKRSRSTLIPFLGFFLFICLIAGCGLGGSIWITTQVTNAFGKPDTNLSFLQRIRYSSELFIHQDELTQPVDKNGEEREFSIEMGESVNTISYRLESAGLISDSNSFRILLIYCGKDKAIQAGAYQLSPNMTALEIVNALQDATPTEIIFNILEGWRLEEIAESIPTSGLSFTDEEFLTEVSQPLDSTRYSIANNGVETYEGFLFPGQYTFSREVTLDEFLDSVANEFNDNVDSDLMEGFSRHGLDLFQAVTLASIVQREAIIPDEQPIIASVFYNRLASNMKLDSDPTVQYAVGYNTALASWWTNPLSLSDLQFDSLYNTYLYYGLPPGPIDNPGISAIRAVAYPADTPYYYFQAACDGSGTHNFAETYEQHLANSCQ